MGLGGTQLAQLGQWPKLVTRLGKARVNLFTRAWHSAKVINCLLRTVLNAQKIQKEWKGRGKLTLSGDCYGDERAKRDGHHAVTPTSVLCVIFFSVFLSVVPLFFFLALCSRLLFFLLLFSVFSSSSFLPFPELCTYRGRACVSLGLGYLMWKTLLIYNLNM